VRADSVEQLPGAFEGAHAARAQAVVVLTGLESFGMRKQIAEHLDLTPRSVKRSMGCSGPARPFP